ncbi:MAG TPA: NAD(P)H-dependent oxidoreductase subunit E [Candidatus Elarobacter sp.]|nr:NAD(P)H-dependent oxidoreductase subunit E [Candidatus Elarobacter sp.]
MNTQSDAAAGVHPGPDGRSATLAVTDWSPHARREGNAFDDLYARLQPQIGPLIAQYEQKRSALIPLAHLFQEHEGYVSADALAAISYLVDETPATVESTISFYTLLFRRPVGKYMVQVCRNLSCMLNGAEEIMSYARRQLGVEHHETTPDGLISYEEVECLAACDRAPCAQVNLEFVYDLTREKIDAMLGAIKDGSYAIAPLPQTVRPGRTWTVAQDTGLKSSGAVGVSNPNNAGGVGDASGVAMFDLIVGRPQYESRSNERLVHETGLRPELPGNGHH